tara:strand:- start:56659 stop:56865 length:207 start_codon:yes stop_codon:yes gene_type:complete
MSKESFEVYTMQYLKDQNYNGCWNHIGNGNTQTTLYIEKDGVNLELNDKEINKVLKSLSAFNPTIRVS